jgi:catechol 2,3-dioxygenase-like lactoylglutathione lyase family enzyme
MIRTRGLTHIALKVADLDRTIAFYAALLDARVLIRNARVAEIGTQGAHDVITLEVSEQSGARSLGTHIGFRLVEPVPVETLAAAVEAAGGTVTESGEFGPGQPYVFARDPDGYEIELWFEPENAVRPE